MKPERIFADTNLFLRYLTNDIPAQADAVSLLLEQAEQGELVLVTNALVMAEIVWTLDSYYHVPKTEIEEKLLAVLNTPGIEVIDSDIVLQAVVQYVEKNVDFIDAYNAAWMPRQSLTTAYTFDRKHFSRFEGLFLSQSLYESQSFTSPFFRLPFRSCSGVGRYTRAMNGSGCAAKNRSILWMFATKFPARSGKGVFDPTTINMRTPARIMASISIGLRPIFWS